MTPLCLRGITWNHSRAFPPLVATAQRFEELHPGVQIRWEKRSLHAFGHADLSELARAFDLLVIDHPMLGDIDALGTLLDLTPLIPSEERIDLSEDSIGPCLESYRWDSKLYALPIDAAAPAAAYRPDLLARAGLSVPETWQQVLDLASRGMVRMPGFPADLFLNLMGLCVSRGSFVAQGNGHLFQNDIAARCLEDLRELASCMPSDIYSLNPIALYEEMASGDSYAYCPFAYTYSNYAREGFARNRLRFADPVRLEDNLPMRTVLGGTGIAISRHCALIEPAAEYSRFVAGRSCQLHLYGMQGGQPARRSAWRDPVLNQLSDDFFSHTETSVESSYLRPRYRNYVALQEAAGSPIAGYLRNGGNATHLLEQIDALYRAGLAEVEEHA